MCDDTRWLSRSWSPPLQAVHLTALPSGLNLTPAVCGASHNCHANQNRNAPSKLEVLSNGLKQHHSCIVSCLEQRHDANRRKQQLRTSFSEYGDGLKDNSIELYHVPTRLGSGIMYVCAAGYSQQPSVHQGTLQKAPPSKGKPSLRVCLIIFACSLSCLLVGYSQGLDQLNAIRREASAITLYSMLLTSQGFVDWYTIPTRQRYARRLHGYAACGA
jgi:hypothetical protein